MEKKGRFHVIENQQLGDKSQGKISQFANKPLIKSEKSETLYDSQNYEG
jgi:hypothetical protein